MRAHGDFLPGPECFVLPVGVSRLRKDGLRKAAEDFEQLLAEERSRHAADRRSTPNASANAVTAPTKPPASCCCLCAFNGKRRLVLVGGSHASCGLSDLQAMGGKPKPREVVLGGATQPRPPVCRPCSLSSRVSCIIPLLYQSASSKLT